MSTSPPTSKKRSNTKRHSGSHAGGKARSSSRSKITNKTGKWAIGIWLLTTVALVLLIYWGVHAPREERERYVFRPYNKEELNSKNENRVLPSQSNELIAAAIVPPPKEEIKPKPPVRPVLGKVAIVIDDFGEDVRIAKEFLNLPLPITLSVLPHLPYTKEIARLAVERGYEVILHLPMQPKSYPETDPGPGALLISMNDYDIYRILSGDLDEDPYIIGVNNHMGSQFTEDKDKMKIVLSEIQRRGLFFLDSFTTPNSVGYLLAKQLGIPCARRDVFLDHKPNREFIVNQIKELIHKAKIQGSAIAIGHPHTITLEILKQQAHVFEEQGIMVVKLSELVK